MKLKDIELENDLLGGEKGGIVIPAILWWMGAPLTLLLVLWFFGVF